MYRKQSKRVNENVHKIHKKINEKQENLQKAREKVKFKKMEKVKKV